MYSIAAEIVFNAGHYLVGSHGKQEQPHHHDWRVRATVESAQLDNCGLVMDFQMLQRLLRQIVEPMKQAEFINNLTELAAGDDTNINPSTERIARYIYDGLARQLPGRVHLTEVLVWETPDNRAAYRPTRD